MVLLLLGILGSLEVLLIWLGMTEVNHFAQQNSVNSLR